MVESKLSYEEYAAWCKSRFPAVDHTPAAVSMAPTVLASNDDACPVTVRCPTSDTAVITPRPKGSR